MALTADAINSMLDHLASEGLYAGLIGADGNTEITGGSPAYARKAVTWAGASDSHIHANGTLPSFDVPACTVTKVGIYSALTAGTLYDVFDVTDEVFAAQGTYTVTAITLTGA